MANFMCVRVLSRPERNDEQIIFFVVFREVTVLVSVCVSVVVCFFMSMVCSVNRNNIVKQEKIKEITQNHDSKSSSKCLVLRGIDTSVYDLVITD